MQSCYQNEDQKMMDDAISKHRHVEIVKWSVELLMLERKQFSNVKIKFKPMTSTAGGLGRVIRVIRVARVIRVTELHSKRFPPEDLSIIYIDNIEHLIIQ